MTTMQCKSCNGVYDTTQKDGVRYFHRCPDSVAPVDRRDENITSTAAIDAGTVKLAGKGTAPAP